MIWWTWRGIKMDKDKKIAIEDESESVHKKIIQIIFDSDLCYRETISILEIIKLHVFNDMINPDNDNDDDNDERLKSGLKRYADS